MDYPKKTNKKNKNFISLKFKLIILIFFSILVPLLIFSYFSNTIIKKNMINQSISNADQLFFKTTELYDYTFNNMYSMANIISSNIFINNIKEELTSAEYHYKQVNAGIHFDNLMTSYKTIFDVDNISIYINNPNVYALDSLNIHNFKYLISQHIYTYVNTNFKNKNTNLWSFPNYNANYLTSSNYDNILTFYRLLPNPDNFNNMNMVIKIDLDMNKLNKTLYNSTLTDGSVTLLHNDSKIVSSTNANFISDQKLNKLIDSNIANNNIWNKIYFNNSTYLFRYTYIANSNCKLVSFIPYNDITSAPDNIQTQLLSLIIIIFISIFIIASILITNMLRRISELLKATKLVNSGNFVINFKNTGNDELSLLMESFTSMSKNLSSLIKEKYELGKALKNQELLALQSQINPHFLYNSLNMISCIALKNKVPEIHRTILNLSKFYKLSLNKGFEFLTIKNEIEHVSLYFSIQNARYENKLKLELDVDSSLNDYHIIKIILQPIVENSILHGILEKETIEGTISISVHRYNEVICLVVEDDGIGMDKDTCESILNNQVQNNTSGYGIKNIHNRIQLFYGLSYGVTIESTPNIGTKTAITIPYSDNNTN